MIWPRVLSVGVWTVCWLVLMFLAMSVGLLGDCPEYINANWPNHACSDHKDIVRYVIFIGGPLIWLVVTALLFRRRSE